MLACEIMRCIFLNRVPSVWGSVTLTCVAVEVQANGSVQSRLNPLIYLDSVDVDQINGYVLYL